MKATEIATKLTTDGGFTDTWIFCDNQPAVRRMRDKRPLPGQEYILENTQKHRNLTLARNRDPHLLGSRPRKRQRKRTCRHPRQRREKRETPSPPHDHLHYLPQTKKQRTPNDDLERQVAHHEARPLLSWPASDQHPPPFAKPPVTKISFNCHTDAHQTWLQPPIPSANTLIHHRIANLPLWLPAITLTLAT